MTYERFRASPHRCPQCNQPATEDNWPPNYGGGAGSMGLDGDMEFAYAAGVKHVCWPCGLQFVVAIERRTKRTNGLLVDSETATPRNVRCLVERGGELMTDHDAWRYDHKQETGESPAELY